MLYPEFFDGTFQVYGVANSTELDIELYFGVLVFVLLMAAAIKKYNDKTYSPDFICCFISVIIMCVAHIPIVCKLFYHIPVLGGFRCSGRALALFAFFVYVICARFLGEISDDDILYCFFQGKAKSILVLTIVLVIVAMQINVFQGGSMLTLTSDKF